MSSPWSRSPDPIATCRPSGRGVFGSQRSAFHSSFRLVGTACTAAAMVNAKSGQVPGMGTFSARSQQDLPRNYRRERPRRRFEA